MVATSPGRYRVLERLGVGQVAEAFLAELVGAGEFRRLLVLKRLLDELARDATHVRTFLDEASLIARLRHPNIVQVLDVFADEGSYAMALELVDGPSLENLVGYTAGVGIGLPLVHGAHMIVEAARGLHYAHEERDAAGQLLDVVHRDVRPNNILISREGEVKVADFSLALSPSARWTRVDRHDYAAPEQAMKADVDRRADVFSLGVILWELATGRRLPPGSLGSPAEPLEPPSQSGAPLADAWLDQIVARATSSIREDRYVSAERFADELSAWLGAAGEPTGRVELARWMRDSCPDLGPAKLVPLSVRTSSATVPTIPPPAKPAVNIPHHGRLVGRVPELAVIDAAMRSGHHFFVLHGPGGVGKTHLATEWARRFCDERGARGIFCDAHHATTSSDVAHRVVGQLAAGTLQPREPRDAVLVARDLLTAGGPTVVVIDQLGPLDDISTLQEMFTADDAELHVIVTSRRALDIDGSASLLLQPFDVSGATGGGSAAELFFDRLPSARASELWRDPSRSALVGQLVQRVGGLPLGIVLTAARAAETSPAEMERGLGTAVNAVLGSGDLASAVVQEAWIGCAPKERDALLQCSAFFGSFLVSDAEVVLQIDGDVARTLAALVDRSLVVAEGEELRLSAVVRELCRSLPETAALRGARERHASHVLTVNEELLQRLRGPGAARAFQLLEKAEPELRGVCSAAVEARAGDVALRAALCLEPTFGRRGDHRQLITMLSLGAASAPSPFFAAKGAMAEARSHGWLFDFQPALDAALRALAQATEADIDSLVAEARSELAMVQVRCGQGDDAAVRYRAALDAMKKAGDRRGEGVVLLRLANLLSERDEAQAATMMYRLALEASRSAQDQIYEGIILSNLGAQLLDDGRPDQAHQALYLSEEIFRRLGEERYGTVSRGLIGVSVMLQGDWERGAKTVEDCVSTLRRVGERGVVVFFLGVLVGAKARLGDRAGALACAAQMNSLSEALSDTPVAHIAKLRRGHLELLDAKQAAESGDPNEARKLVASARIRAASAPRDVLTTLRIAAADLLAHCDLVEEAITPSRRPRRQASLGRLRLAKSSGRIDRKRDDQDPV
jgi:tetratricopeptide (TPR) repeat protein